MWSSYQNTIDFIHLNSKLDEDVAGGSTSMTWEAIVGQLMQHDVRAEKDGLAFIPVKFKPQSEWIEGISMGGDGKEKKSLRVNENVESISVAVFDLDTPDALEQGRKAFANFEHVIYSTHSYNKDAPYKCRIALKLEEPISSENWNEFVFNIAKAIEIDESCKNLSRLFYYPSISPDAGIAPISEYQSGQSLKLSDAFEIGKNHARELSEEELEKLKGRFGFSERSASRRHFSGSDIPLYKRNAGKADYSWEGMLVRHEDKISQLRNDDGRHNFARDVMGREVVLQGDRIDLDRVMSFIYRVTLTNGSKPITAGNTPREIPKLLMGAFSKYAKTVAEDNPHFIEQLPGLTEKALQKAEASMVTGTWDFDTASKANVASKSGPAKGVFDSNSFSYSALRGRHKSNINSFLRENDFTGFVLDVFDAEIAKHGNKTDLNAVGQFVFYCLNGVAKHRQLGLGEFQNEIIGLSELRGELNLSSIPSSEKEQFERFFNTSIKLGNHALSGRIRWRFPEEPSQELSR